MDEAEEDGKEREGIEKCCQEMGTLTAWWLRM